MTPLGLGAGFYGLGSTGENVVVGLDNYSIAFDGTNDYLSVSHDGSLNFADGSQDYPLSISFWLKVDDLSGSAAQGILIKGEEYKLYIDPPNERIFFIRRDDSANKNIRVRADALVEDTWQHFLVTSDDSETALMYIYLNGVLTSTISGVTTGSATETGYVASENDSTDLYIGRASGSSSGAFGTSYQYLDGSLANIAFWRAELSAANAVTLYNGGINFDVANSGIPGSLQASWRFAEQTGIVAADSSSNSNRATLENGPNWVTE